MKVIFESKRPRFALGKDRYQWILARRQKARGEWTDYSYHPNLSNLLDELAEFFFKKNTKKLKTLKELDKSIDRVYDLILRVRRSKLQVS